MEKPEKLYHASADRTIERFEPRADSVRDRAEGPQVFAAPDKATASMFIVPTDDRWVRKGAFDGVPYMVISDKQKFTELDKGGAIYHLPNGTFQTNPNKGMGSLEWTSAEPVEPLAKEEYESGLETMLENGVQVYFVDAGTFAAITGSRDHGLSLLQASESENQRRGINVAELRGRE